MANETETEEVEETVESDAGRREDEFDDLRDRVAALSDRANDILEKLNMLDDIMAGIASLATASDTVVSEESDDDDDTGDNDEVNVETPLEDLDFSIDGE